MLAATITTFIILLISLTRNVTSAENGRDSVRSDDDSRMLREILQRLNQMQSDLDQMKTNNNIRFDKLEANTNDLKMQNLSVVMETIVEQQMVITAEIFTVSQTLPFCCCHYQSSTDAPAPAKNETTTPKPIKSLTSSCAEATEDGVYEFNIKNSNIGPFHVYCMKKVAKSIEEDIINGTWMIIQRRQDRTTDFYRNWNMYKHGFGDLKGNFWIGLDKLHALTKSTEYELWVQLEDPDNITAWAKYSHFAIGNEKELYKLKTLGRFDGTAGDSLSRQKGASWSTYDKDHDTKDEFNCAATIRQGGWWNTDCGNSNLNGIYDGHDGNCILWVRFRGWNISMKYAHMAIQRHKNKKQQRKLINIKKL